MFGIFLNPKSEDLVFSGSVVLISVLDSGVFSSVLLNAVTVSG